ncbi:MAG: glycosyltransferase family 4 protein [Gammaproteobacteria bacterium]
MRIAQVAPLFESVPPKLYGGTERVVSYLTEELVKQGHDVTLFATADSITAARLRAIVRQGLRLDPDCQDPSPYHVIMLEEVLRASPSFDIIHFHTDYLHFGLTRRLLTPHITTLHGRLDLPYLVPLYKEFDDVPLVSISNSQRVPLSWANWQATVYHGLPLNQYQFHDRPGKYLAFIGRISPEKRVDHAIEVARRVGMEIRIAAKVDKADREYFETRIKPLLRQPYVNYIGEIGDSEKGEFLGNAFAMLFTVDWPEPFGLAMIEAFACGTPVIACRRGSVPEVMEDGRTGYIVNSLDEAVAAVEKVAGLDRRQVRHVFEKRFSATRMARDYLTVYRKVDRQRLISQATA